MSVRPQTLSRSLALSLFLPSSVIVSFGPGRPSATSLLQRGARCSSASCNKHHTPTTHHSGGQTKKTRPAKPNVDSSAVVTLKTHLAG